MDEGYPSRFFPKTSRYLILSRFRIAISMNLVAFSTRFAGSDQTNQKRSHQPRMSLVIRRGKMHA